jgi:BirA family biotin operon repressor/biotin-[acetyl-CoA-carboxylase] ligase
MSGLFSKEKITWLETVDSTNDYVLRMMNGAEKPAEGTLVAARHQFQGRGLGSNIWISEAGKNLTFSFILRPSFLEPERQFMLNKVVALALADFTATVVTEAKIRIKWPNDLYIDHYKTAGILINFLVEGSRIEGCVVGIGLNVNQVSFPLSLPNPASLATLTKKEYDIETCLDQLCRFIEMRYDQLKSGNSVLIDRDYHSLLYQYGVFRPYLYRGSRLQARITGVDEFGRLQLVTSSGLELVCDIKELIYLPGK